MNQPTLYVFSGLPGSGKTTLSQRLARDLGAVHLRIDTIEQALRDLTGMDVEGEGYRLAYRLAADNLRLQLDVIADSCNPIALTRREWQQVADSAAAVCVNVEIVCSDPVEHRRRVEQRTASIPNLKLPSWEDVKQREYHEWHSAPVRIDTAASSPEHSYRSLRAALGLS